MADSRITEWVESAKNFNELAETAKKQLITVGIALGSLLLVLYAVKEGFFYDVSSLATVALLLIVVATFAFVWSFLLLYGCILAAPLVHAVVWINNRYVQKRVLSLHPFLSARTTHLLALTVGAFVGVAAYAGRNVLGTEFWAGASYFLLCGLMLDIIFGVRDVGLQRRSLITVARDVAVAAFVTVMYAFFIHTGTAPVFDEVFSILSLRSGRSDVVLLRFAQYKKVSLLAARGGISIQGCPFEGDTWEVQGLTVIWHSVGSTAYVSLDEHGPKRIVIAIPSSDIDVVRGNRPALLACPPAPV